MSTEDPQSARASSSETVPQHTQDCLDFLGRYVEAVLLGRPAAPDAVRHVTSCARCASGADDVWHVSTTFARAELAPSIWAADVGPGSRGEPRPRSPQVPLQDHRLAVQRTNLVAPPTRRARAAGPGAHGRHPRQVLLATAAAVLLITGVAATGASLIPDEDATPSAVTAPNVNRSPANPDDAASHVQQVVLLRDGLMIPHPWGAEVPIVLEGLQNGRTYHLATQDASGNLAPAGSVRADGRTVRTHMTTAMTRDQITALLITDSVGTSLARMAVQPPSPATAPPA